MLSSLQRTEEEIEGGLDLFRVDLVYHIPHLAVLWNGGDLKEGLQVVGMGLILKTSLELQHRWFLKVHHGKTAHQHIMNSMTGLLRISAVGYTAENPGESLSQPGKRKVLLDVHEKDRSTRGRESLDIHMIHKQIPFLPLHNGHCEK